MRKSPPNLYKTQRWKRLRGQQLARQPYCQCPHHVGKRVRATVVDHKVAHRGDSRLFFQVSNLQSMAKSCHDKFKQSQEKGGAGFDQGFNAAGEPLNPNHDWYSTEDL